MVTDKERIKELTEAIDKAMNRWIDLSQMKENSGRLTLEQQYEQKHLEDYIKGLEYKRAVARGENPKYPFPAGHGSNSTTGDDDSVSKFKFHKWE